ncbi:glutamine amidotransferase [Chelatococcus sp. YT9]|nr:glutamine amidotransferase [Chelatococcus sp. YT9]
MFNHLLLIQVGTPPDDIRDPLGDFPLWFHRVLRHPGEALHVVRVFEGEHLPAPKAVRGAIITGSWHMVTERLPWSEATAHWIRDAMAIELPLFGICYGHQLIAHALGGRVDYHPQGREIGTQTIRLLAGAEDDPLLQAMPVRFSAHLTHMQTIIDLPIGARALAASDHDRHQIVRYGPNAISTQFHPEFTPEICAAIIRLRTETLCHEGRDPTSLLAAVEDAPEPAGLLRRFATLTLHMQPTAASVSA